LSLASKTQQFFYSDKEFEVKFGEMVNIQQLIEEPELHFIANCSSSDHELLLYSETRLKCIQELKNSCFHTINNIAYADKMRFCHGDMPLRAFEARQQKGGNYFCSSCGVHCDMTYELDHVLNCKSFTIQDRQNVILQGKVLNQNNIQTVEAQTFGRFNQERTGRRVGF
jgi:hypothetical protein